MRDGKADRFKVDENGYTVDGYRRLEPESKKSMYLGNLIGIVIVAAIAYALMQPGVLESLVTIVAIIAVVAVALIVIGYIAMVVLYAILALVVVYGLVEPEIMYRRYRYRMDDDKIEVRRGIIYITHAMVPIERVHQVDVSEGPINRMYGLANVNITTAGGVVTIEYLKEDVAEGIAAKLNENVVKLLRERDQS